MQAAQAQSLTRLDGSTIEISGIEERIPQLMAEVWLPGMSVAVVHDGAIAYRASFGVRDVRTRLPITAETSFAGLSFSKTITAYLVHRLVERQVFDLDRPLHTYLSKPLPDYAFYADLAGDSRWEAITARHVLSHTTGWPNWRWFTEKGSLSFLFEPGERHSYSGEGFAYLQLALEEGTGKDFATLAHDEVFAPLGMRRSSMVWRSDFEDDFAEDHDLLGGPLARERRDEASAAGSLQTTLLDYTRFVIAVMNAQGLRYATRDAMLTPQVAVRHARMFGPRLYEESAEPARRKLAWSLGWGHVATPYGPAFFHTGNDVGSANYTIAFPEARAAVVLLGNSQRLEGIAEDVVALLTGDRSSPFDFLGYWRWDSPRQRWLRALAEGGVAAGRELWQRLGEARAEHGLEDESAFATGGDAVARFRGVDEAIAFQEWRRKLFPTSPAAVKAAVRLRIDAGRTDEAVASLEAAVDPDSPHGPELADALDWFGVWARTLSDPVAVPAELLARYAGDYGARRFDLRDGSLFYGRDATPPEDYAELHAVSDDTFVLPGVDFFRLRFELDSRGVAVRVHGLYENGDRDSNERGEPW